MAAKNQRNMIGAGSYRLRNDGRWQGRITIDGHEKNVYGKNEAEVKKKIREWTIHYYRGEIVPKNWTVEDYVEQYLKNHKLGYVKQSTYDRYESTYIHHIRDTVLGRKKMAKVKNGDIQQFLKLKANPSNVDEKPLSQSSVKKILELLRMTFKFAENNGDIPKNPMFEIRLPREENFLVKTKKNRTLTEEEIRRIKEIADTKTEENELKWRYGAVAMVLLNTGLRCGEFLALEWSDVNFEKRTISITKNVESSVKKRDESGKVIKRENIVTTPKTSNGRRVLPMNNSSEYYLRELKEYAERNKIETKYVAYTRIGTRTNARNLQRDFSKILKRAGVENCNLHTLRHTFGSMLVRKGVQLVVVSRMMGHSNIQITINRYIHILQEQQAEGIELLDVG